MENVGWKEMDKLQGLDISTVNDEMHEMIRFIMSYKGISERAVYIDSIQRLHDQIKQNQKMIRGLQDLLKEMKNQEVTSDDAASLSLKNDY